MNKNKGCCGCLSFGCGGLLLVLVIIGFLGFKLISPVTNKVMFFAKDEVCKKIFETTINNTGINEQSITEIKSWLKENGYTIKQFNIEKEVVEITKENYRLLINGWNWNYNIDNGVETETGNFYINLTKDGKSVELSSIDIKNLFSSFVKEK